MTQEDKQLLLTDLSARLPYKVKIEITWWVVDEGTCMNTTLEPDHIDQLLNDDDTEIKPYLRPMSSMTDEEEVELGKLIGKASYNMMHKVDFYDLYLLLEFIYKKHLDYNHLIEKGLANEAPNDMYKI